MFVQMPENSRDLGDNCSVYSSAALQAVSSKLPIVTNDEAPVQVHSTTGTLLCYVLCYVMLCCVMCCVVLISPSPALAD